MHKTCSLLFIYMQILFSFLYLLKIHCCCISLGLVAEDFAISASIWRGFPQFRYLLLTYECCFSVSCPLSVTFCSLLPHTTFLIPWPVVAQWAIFCNQSGFYIVRTVEILDWTWKIPSISGGMESSITTSTLSIGCRQKSTALESQLMLGFSIL